MNIKFELIRTLDIEIYNSLWTDDIDAALAFLKESAKPEHDE